MSVEHGHNVSLEGKRYSGSVEGDGAAAEPSLTRRIKTSDGRKVLLWEYERDVREDVHAMEHTHGCITARAIDFFHQIDVLNDEGFAAMQPLIGREAEFTEQQHLMYQDVGAKFIEVVKSQPPLYACNNRTAIATAIATDHSAHITAEGKGYSCCVAGDGASAGVCVG